MSAKTEELSFKLRFCVWCIGEDILTNPHGEEHLVRLCYFWYGIFGNISMLYGMIIWPIVSIAF